MTAVVENIPNCKTNEMCLQNVIEKDVLSVTKPFDLMQALFILSKYKIRDGFITSNSFLYNVVSGIWSLILSVCFFFSSFTNILITGLNGFNYVKCYSNALIFVVYFLGNVVNYCNNVTQRHNNVLLALKIQNICEIFKINGKTLKNFTILNWIYTIVLICFNITWIFYFYYAFSIAFPFVETITGFFYIIFHIQILYSGRLMKLITETLREWVDEVRKLIFVPVSENEYYWNRKFRVYMAIVEAYEIVGKTFQPLILYYFIAVFTNVLLAILIRIELAKVIGVSINKIALLLTSLFWVFRNMGLLTNLCLEYERFYTVLIEVRGTCIQLTTSDRCSETQKRVCKNILRVQTAYFKKMSACGLFVIDEALPLRFIGLLSAYVIVVLQFEFL